jgi:type VI secretion system protein ImpH
MGAALGRENAPLNEHLRDQPGEFDFFQAVRLLLRMAESGVLPGQDVTSTSPRLNPVGFDYSPLQEVVRFRTVQSLAFPAAPVAKLNVAQIPEPPPDIRRTAIRGGEPKSRLEMFVTFLGFTGPSGVLPAHYTSQIIDRLKEKDPSLAEFFDLFNHRLTSLFYRAWEKYRFPIALERFRLAPQRDETDDFFTWCLYSLVGVGTHGLRARQQFDDEALLYYAGHFAHWPRNAVSLEAIVNDYFGLSIEVRQFQGQWLKLEFHDQSALPNAMQPRGLNCELGVNVIAGERVWDVQSKFRHRVGPLSYFQFCRLMPSGDMLRPLCQMTRTYAGPQFDFDVQPILKADEVPWCQLGGDGPTPSRLGWNTWVRANPMPHDADDVVFSLEDV